MPALRRLLTAVLLASTLSSLSLAPAQAQSTKGSTAATKTTGPVTADGSKLDINTATADQLKAFSGIGDAYSARIIAGRPYTAKNQLVQRGILPQATYDKIKDNIIASRPVKK